MAVATHGQPDAGKLARPVLIGGWRNLTRQRAKARHPYSTAWLPTGRFGIECLANLDKVPTAGATLVIGAPKHKGGTGGPARIFALV